jgi:hypothetical protein
VHAVEDEQIVALTISQEEGDFASAQIDVKNPGGLLAPGRTQWAWLSWHDGTVLQPLLCGRLVAVPEQLDGEKVRLLLLAKPENYDSIKSDYAETLKVLPYWDTVWFMGDLSDADAVLDAYGAQWHVDRTTLELTYSDELEGEDGTIEIGEGDHTYDNFEMSYTDPPLSQVEIEGTLTWRQTGSGTVDLTKRITQAFEANKTIYTYVDYGLITTLTGDGLLNAWPEGGTDFGGGWTVSNDTHRGVRSDYDVNNDSDRTISAYWLRSKQDYEITFDVAAFEQRTLFDWAADRGRTEIIKLTMVADIQAMLADPLAEDNIERLTLNASDTVTEPDADGVMPIGDAGRKAYLPTDRGADSVQHLLLLGRAKLRHAARAVEVKCRVPWELGVQASLRHNARIYDRRLPGGEAAGKITGYELSAAGTGEFWADLTIGCAVGHGGGITAAPGEPDYVEDGYVYSGYQTMTGAEIMAPTGDIAYSSLDAVTIDDDGVDLLTLDERTAVQTLTVTNGLGPQVIGLNESDDPANALADAPTEVCVQMVPLTDLEFSTTFSPTLTPVPIPRTVNLEAA